MTWTPARDELPAEGEPVLLYLPNYELPRPALAILRKGDPEAEGDHYRLDSWLCAALRGVGATVQTVRPEHLWARIPTPEGVDGWTGAVFTFPEEPAPEPVLPPEPQAPLFEVAP